MPTEDEKALEHLAQERRREAFQRSLQEKLRGDPQALADLKKKVEPLLRTGSWGKLWR